MYRNAVISLAGVMILLGGAMIVVTLASAGFGVGILLGLLFIAAGSLRIWLLRGRPR